MCKLPQSAGMVSQSIMASLPQTTDVLYMRDLSWPRSLGWPSCFACAIDCVFVAADGRGLVARSQKFAHGSEVCTVNR